MKNNPLIWGLFLFFPFFSVGQNVPKCKQNAVVLILDEHNREPLEKGSIRFKNQVYFTQKQGQSLLPIVCLGDTLILSHLGCDPKTEVIHELPDTLVFFLEHHAFELNTTEIIFKKRNWVQRSEFMPGKEPDNLGRSFAQMLQQNAGASTLQTCANIEKPVLLGLTGNRVTYLQNGIRMESQSWGNEHAWETDPLTKQNIEILLGSKALWYGTDGIGGMINSSVIQPNTSSKPWYFIHGQTQGRGGNLGLFAPVSTKMGLFSIQGTFKKLGDFSTPSYVLRNTGIEENSGSFSFLKQLENRRSLFLNFQIFNTETGILSWSHIGNLSDLRRTIDSNLIPQNEVFSYSIDRPRQKAQHQWIFGQWNDRQLQITFSRQYNYRSEYDKHNSFGMLGENPQNEFGLAVNSFAVEKLKKWKGWGFRLDGRNISQDYGGKYFVPQYQGNVLGFSGERIFPEGNWRKTLVVRMENHSYHAIVTNLGKQPNLGAMGWGVGLNLKNESWRNAHLVFSMGRNWRFPGMNELFSNGLHHGTASIELGNVNLKPEVAYFIEGLLKKEMGKTSISAFSHFKTAFNFINLEPTGDYSLSVRGAFPVYHYTASNVVSWVQDFSVSRSDFFIPNLNAQIKSSIVRLKEWGNSSNLLGVPPMSVQAQLTYQKERRGIVLKPILKANYTSFPFWAPKNLEIGRLPEGFLLVDLGTNFYWKDWSGSFQVNNALNQNYFNYLDRLRYFASAPGRNISIQLKKQIR